MNHEIMAKERGVVTVQDACVAQPEPFPKPVDEARSDCLVIQEGEGLPVYNNLATCQRLCVIPRLEILLMFVLGGEDPLVLVSLLVVGKPARACHLDVVVRIRWLRCANKPSSLVGRIDFRGLGVCVWMWYLVLGVVAHVSCLGRIGCVAPCCTDGTGQLKTEGSHQVSQLLPG